MRLRNRPWKLLALLIFGTISLIFFGINLLSGPIELRRLGEVSAAGTPIKFVIVVIGYIILWMGLTFMWVIFAHEWGRDHRPRFKPPLDDPDKRSPL